MKQLAMLAEVIGGGAACGWVLLHMMDSEMNEILGIFLYLGLCTVMAIALCLPWMLTE